MIPPPMAMMQPMTIQMAEMRWRRPVPRRSSRPRRCPLSHTPRHGARLCGREAASQVVEKTKEGAVKTKDAVVKGTKIAAEKTKDGLSKTGEVMTDGWITTRVHAHLVDEDLLKDSDINVDTSNMS